MDLNFRNALFYLQKIDAFSMRENSYIFNNKDTSLPFILSPFHTRARVIIRDCEKKKKEHSGPRFKTRAYSITGHCITEATSRIFSSRLF